MDQIIRKKGKGIFHRSILPYVYSYSKDVVHIRLQSKRGQINKVELLYGDPFDFTKNKWVSYSQEMFLFGSDEFFDWWIAAIKPPSYRLRYAFRLTLSSFIAVSSFIPNSDSNSPFSSPNSSPSSSAPSSLNSSPLSTRKNKNKGGIIYYTEKGFTKKRIQDNIFQTGFAFPYLHLIDVFTPPEWVKDTVWYQIIPERFSNGDPSLNPPGTLPWGSVRPKVDSFFGGDFQGIIDHIDHLKELGINGVYLTPIFLSKSNHKYDIIDYFEIDPQFGNKETFSHLVKTLHQNGIRIMLDAVFNHCGVEFFAFKDVCENGNQSKYKDWFYFDDGLPLTSGLRPNYRTFAFEGYMPKLNTQNQEVKNYFLLVGQYWVREFGIDGWRLDVANEVDHSFWRDFRSANKSINPDCFIVGELWHDALPWLHGDQFDSVMNYPLQSAVLNFFTKASTDNQANQTEANQDKNENGEEEEENEEDEEEENDMTAYDFKACLTKLLMMYPDGVNSVLFTLLDSHDTGRILTKCDGNRQILKLILLFHLSFVGSPCIYYGTEIGMEGKQDPDCRACMIWEKENQDLELFEFVKQLIIARKNCEAFCARGNLRFSQNYGIENEGKLLLYEKSYGKTLLLFALNNQDKIFKGNLKHSAFLKSSNDTKTTTGKVKDFFQGNEIFIHENGWCPVEIPSFGFVVLHAESDQSF